MSRPAVNVSIVLDLSVTWSGLLAFSVALADGLAASESLVVTDSTGNPADLAEVILEHGARMHIIRTPIGSLSISYQAVSTSAEPAPSPLAAADRLRYLRPSRYCPSDQLAGLAAAQFGGLADDPAKVMAITEWIHQSVAYLPGTTDSFDDALRPLLSRQGVCRDFAHLGITLCRALGIPARYVSVYAPGLDPMDVHAVFEAAIDGYWHVFDATRLAPRTSLVRIATGRDAADAALLSPMGAASEEPILDVLVTADPDLPVDDVSALVTLG